MRRISIWLARSLVLMLPLALSGCCIVEEFFSYQCCDVQCGCCDDCGDISCGCDDCCAGEIDSRYLQSSGEFQPDNEAVPPPPKVDPEVDDAQLTPPAKFHPVPTGPVFSQRAPQGLLDVLAQKTGKTSTPSKPVSRKQSQRQPTLAKKPEPKTTTKLVSSRRSSAASVRLATALEQPTVAAAAKPRTSSRLVANPLFSEPKLSAPQLADHESDDANLPAVEQVDFEDINPAEEFSPVPSGKWRPARPRRTASED